MNFTNPTILKLRQEVWDYQAKEKGLKADQTALQARIKALLKAELAGAGDPAALAAARDQERDLEGKLAICREEQDRLEGELQGAIAAEIGGEARDLGPLRQQVAELRQAAAWELGQALGLIKFLQGPLVFSPDELLLVQVGRLAGKKSEPPYYKEVLAAVSAGAAAIAAELPQDYPEFASFRDLVKRLRFLEAWAGPPASTAKTPAEWQPATGPALANKSEHLKVLVRQLLAGQDKE